MVLGAYLLVLPFIWTEIAAKSQYPPCDLHMFESNVDNCLSDFNRSMETEGYQAGCPWPGVKGIYNNLKICVDDWAKVSWCQGQGSLIDKIFLKVHQKYFRQCGQVQDPPLVTVVMLIAPVVIATLLMPALCVKLAPSDTSL